MPSHIYTLRLSETPDAPALILLHGTGGDEHSLLELGAELNPGATLIGIKGNVMEGSAPRYFRRLSEGVFDLEDLALRTKELDEFLSWLRVEHNLIQATFTIVGYSNGANIAANLLLTGSKNIQQAVLFRAIAPTDPATLPDLKGVKVLIQAGEHDTMMSKPETEHLHELLLTSGATCEMRFQPGGHNLSYTDVMVAKEWLEA
ncbi:alpha/beta hydrolase [soil metagenome]